MQMSLKYGKYESSLSVRVRVRVRDREQYGGSTAEEERRVRDREQYGGSTASLIYLCSRSREEEKGGREKIVREEGERERVKEKRGR